MTATVNDALFVRVLAQIEREPETWDQQQWNSECGTTYCFAGWACALSGFKMAGYGIVQASPDDRSVGTVAQGALGIRSRFVGDDGGDHGLFLDTNSLDDLYRISAGLMGVDEQTLRDKVAAEVADGRTIQ